MDFTFCIIINKGVYNETLHGKFDHIYDHIVLGGNTIEVCFLMIQNKNNTLYIIERKNNEFPEAEILYLAQKGCMNYIACHSVGSLKNEYHLGSLVMPSDFIVIPHNDFKPTFKHDFNSSTSEYHSDLAFNTVYPEIDKQLKDSFFRSLLSMGHSIINSGIYIQNNNSHFETLAEVRLYAKDGDYVGHSLADEAIFVNGFGGKFVMLGIVDNMGKGLDERKDRSSLSNYLHNSSKHTIITSHAIQTIIRDFKNLGRNLISVDLVIYGKYVLTCSSVNAPVLEKSAVVINDGKIVDILPSDQVLMKYSSRESRYRMSHAIIPGLINCHAHSSMSLLRGFGDDLPLLEWLHTKIWPVEGEFCKRENFLEDGMRIAIGEMLHSGITCFNDMYFRPENTIDVCINCGIRAVLGFSVLDFPTLDGENPKAQLKKHESTLKSFYEKTDNQNSLISFAVCPHAPYTVGDDTWKMVKDFAITHKLPIHSHIHETSNEVIDSSEQNKSSPSCHRSDSRSSPIINLNRLGMFDDTHFIAVHMTCLSNEEIDIIKVKNVHVIHNPTSNLKLASGYCPVKKLLDEKVNVALGTDSCASNNSLSILSEMKLAAILGSVVAHDASAVTAREVLYMATKGGAIALGMENKIGSIEVGKCGDIVSLDVDRLEMVPLYDIVSQIVYSAGRDNITDVWVEGKNVLRNQLLSCVDDKVLFQVAQNWANRILQWKESGKL